MAEGDEKPPSTSPSLPVQRLCPSSLDSITQRETAAKANSFSRWMEPGGDPSQSVLALTAVETNTQDGQAGPGGDHRGSVEGALAQEGEEGQRCQS